MIIIKIIVGIVLGLVIYTIVTIPHIVGFISYPLVVILILGLLSGIAGQVIADKLL
jgi:uncharacterized protein YciW